MSILAFLLSLNAADLPPPEYDHPYDGQTVVEVMPLEAVKARCQNAWDIHLLQRNGYPDAYATACSWRYTDVLNPGREVCHQVFARIEDGVWTADEELQSIKIETANCNGWHDARRAQTQF